MNYLFFDLEFATSKGGQIKICEFGYVVTDENFKIIKRDNFIINPNISRKDWDYRVVRKILNREINEYEKGLKFNYYYNDIFRLICNADYIFGHTLDGDVKALNDECKRYGLNSLNFKFYDIKEFYKQYSATSKSTSLTNILHNLEIEGESGEHDAEVDAVNTMLELKEMIQKLEVSVEELIELSPSAESYNKDYVIYTLEDDIIATALKESDNNYLHKGSINSKIFAQFSDNVLPTTNEEQTLKGLKFSISFNYEEKNYRQMLNIAQILCNKGAIYVRKASLCDVFVTFKEIDDNGNEKECLKSKLINDEIAKGANIKIISFDSFLEILGLTKEKLDNLPLVSFDCLYKDNVYIKDPNIRKYFKKNKKEKELVTVPSQNDKVTLGDIYGELFEKIKKDLQ